MLVRLISESYYIHSNIWQSHTASNSWMSTYPKDNTVDLLLEKGNVGHNAIIFYDIDEPVE